MPLDFPNSPTTGQTWNATNGAVYAWDGSKWTLAPASGGPFLPLSGGTVTGDTTFNTNIDANTGIFGGIAYPGQRAGGAALTWVGQSDNGWMSYYDTQSFASFISPPAYPIGVVSSVRSSDRLTGPNSANIAYAAYAATDSTDNNSGFTWAYYGSSRRFPGSHITIGMELSMGNLGSTVELNCYTGIPQGSTVGLNLSCGSEAYEAGETVYPASAAITVVSNGSTWAKGLVMQNNALLADGNGHMKAVQLPPKGEIQWTFDNTGTRSSFIRCDATAAGGPGISFQNTALNVVNAAETTTLLQVTNTKATLQIGLSFGGRTVTTATDVTQHIALYDGFGGLSVSSDGYMNIVAGNAVVMRTAGTGANFPAGQPVSIADNLFVSGQGRFFGTVGFNGAAASAKPTITGAKAGNLALASLLTALANYGLVTDSTT